MTIYKVNKKNKKKLKRIKMQNRRLIKKYPWLQPYSWTGKIRDDYDYTYTLWDDIPKGWKNSFGQMYLKELGSVVKDAGLNREFILEEIKEKYGALRIYTNVYNEKINRIISKYERLSENICIDCGKPDVPIITTGWISPMCFDCYKKAWRKRDKWHKAYDENHIPAPDEKILEAYKEDINGSSDVMADSYTVCRFDKDGDRIQTYDISETTNAIRRRWKKRKGKMKNG